MASSRALSVPELLAAIAVSTTICVSFFLAPRPDSLKASAPSGEPRN